MPPRYSAIKPMFEQNRWRIFPGDKVARWRPRNAEEKQIGTVLQVIKDRKMPMVVVEGWNLRKKKVANGSGVDDFFVVTMEAPLPYATVGVVDPNSQKPVRVKFRYTETGERVRVGRGRGSSSSPEHEVIIPIPKQEDENPSSGMVGEKDTPHEEATKVTYNPKAQFPYKAFMSGGGAPPSAPSSMAAEALSPLVFRSQAAPTSVQQPQRFYSSRPCGAASSRCIAPPAAGSRRPAWVGFAASGLWPWARPALFSGS